MLPSQIKTVAVIDSSHFVVICFKRKISFGFTRTYFKMPILSIVKRLCGGDNTRNISYLGSVDKFVS